MTDSLVILDGGTGRELARRGAPFRQPEWSALALIEGPQFVSAVHRAYVEAGADVITTNSYALVPFHICLLYTSPSPRDRQKSRMPSSA